ncbi:MAG: response regulator [Rhizobiales bacterium]|nr:response regulator [Hyphomicrobiales bacterium]MBI3673271.1 response regulator [Hyphomicrobiales bacterium]
MAPPATDIVILDDDRDHLSSVVDLLTDCGYRVKAFTDADTAIDFAMGHGFSVGLFDYRLGSLKSGLDVVEKMQALGCKSVFVMVTADVGEATQMRALHLKLFEFMKKPVDPEKLLDTVQRALDHAGRPAA